MLVADPSWFARTRIDMRNVGYMDGKLLLDDPAGIAHARPGMSFGHVDSLHDNTRVGGKHAQDFARLAFVASGDDDDVVASFDLQLRHGSGSGLTRPRGPVT